MITSSVAKRFAAPDLRPLRLILVILLLPALVPLGSVADGSPVPGTQAALDSLNLEAYRAFRARDFRTADRVAHEAQALYGPNAGRESAGIAIANLAAILTVQARFEEAKLLQREADSLFTAAGLDKRRGRLMIACAVTDYLSARKYSDAEPEQAFEDLARAAVFLDTSDLRLRIITAEILCRSTHPDRFQLGYANLRRLVSVSEREADNTRTSVCASHLAVMEGTSGGHRAALDYCAKVCEIEREQQDELRVCAALLNIGLAHKKLSNYAASEDAYTEALDVARRVGDRRMQFLGRNDLAQLLSEAGRPDASRRMNAGADSMLRSIVADLRSSEIVDDILFDFHGLLRRRYANLLPYEADLFRGFCDQLALDPTE